MIRDRNIDPHANIAMSKIRAGTIPADWRVTNPSLTPNCVRLENMDEFLVAESAVVEISAAELSALYTTPKEIIAAPAFDGLAIIVDEAIMVTVAPEEGEVGHAVAEGEDLVLRYEDANGGIAATCEATGFIDQTTAQTRLFGSPGTAVTPLAKKAIVLHLTAGNPDANGTMSAKIKVRYHLASLTI
jgi:hypothetical protein